MYETAPHLSPALPGRPALDAAADDCCVFGCRGEANPLHDSFPCIMRIHPPRQERGGPGTHTRRAPVAGFTLQTFSIAMTVSGAIEKKKKNA